ncbi:MAG: carboxylating nicotinate-nucleotide diphosphorylase [Rhizobacter sp.]|nr:carboxylating nicotinate-nucleotide diphosphorylase [Ferruginibacter sp.]
MNIHQQTDLLIKNALLEDIADGDHSTLSTIDPSTEGKAVLKIKQDGILAGMLVAEKIFRSMEPGIEFSAFKKDGDAIKYGEKAFEVKAKVHTILQCERLVLNCMQRMSGIATLTNSYVQKLQGYKTRLLDTRKTTPNFRVLEKEAVRIGGALNHRFGLYDMIMLKDNHIDYCGGIKNAIDKAYDYVQTKKPGLKIEVETRSIADVETVMQTGKIDRIMLDNFTPELIVIALKIISGKYETEASGGINYNNLESYAATGVDFISSGAIIHQAVSLDLSLKAVKL